MSNVPAQSQVTEYCTVVSTLVLYVLTAYFFIQYSTILYNAFIDLQDVTVLYCSVVLKLTYCTVQCSTLARVVKMFQ